MAEPDNALMLEILKDIRKDVTDVRKDVTGIRKEQDNHRTLLLELLGVMTNYRVKIENDVDERLSGKDE